MKFKVKIDPTVFVAIFMFALFAACAYWCIKGLIYEPSKAAIWLPILAISFYFAAFFVKVIKLFVKPNNPL